MKSITVLLLFTLFGTALFAQEKETITSNKEVVTDTIPVSGVCGMCQERIQEAAYIKGVKKATWDKNAQSIVVTYRADKTTALDIQEAIAAVGHDTRDVKATEKAYGSLPGCCKYHEVEAH